MVNKFEWDELRKKCMGSVYQSYAWAETKKKSGVEVMFIEFRDNEMLSAGIVAYEQEIKTPFGKKKILVSEGTPLFTNTDAGLEILKKFKKESKKYFYGIVHPTVVNPEHESFIKSGFRRYDNYTILINLEKTEEELKQGLEKKSARWGVNTAIKNNLSFEEAKTVSDLEKFYNMYKETAEKGGFKAKPISFISELLNSKIGKLFVMKKGTEIVAGGMILIDNIYTILSLTSANEEGNKLQAMPFLYWNLILFSKKLGKKNFDLGGYSKDAEEGEKLYNINQFKENFGGIITEQPSYCTNFKYSFIRILMRRFKFIKKLYKKS